MRGSVTGSVAVHLFLLAVLFAVRQPVSIVVPGPDMVQVALVDPASLVAPAPAPEPAPKPEIKPDEIKPEEDTGVKLEPPKKKKKEEPRVEPPKQAEAPALPTAAVGSSGLRGDLAVDSGNFEFTYYLILIRNRIASNWMPPAGISTGGNPVRAVVYFRVRRGGELSAVRLEAASGVEFFDRSAMRAVTISDPMPPLPLGFAGGELGVHFGFEWEAP
jgi:protein TonB